jgi:hypothetical protein
MINEGMDEAVGLGALIAGDSREPNDSWGAVEGFQYFDFPLDF